MQLVIDIGNTRTKVAIFKEQKLIHVFSFKQLNVKNLRSLFKKYPQISTSIISNVAEVDKTIIQYLKANTKLIPLSYRCKLPILLKYKTPHTLGNDRLAAAIAAAALYPQKNCLIIDAGTCIKYDLVTSKGQYIGGSIAPGIVMQLKALHHFTGKLPLIKPEKRVELVGNSTKTSILSGVINGSAAQANNIMEQYCKKYLQLHIILTGGDAPYFEKTLKTRIFAQPNLVLIGLNKILLLNE